MHHPASQSNTIAPLVNVSLCSEALQKAMDRPRHLPGMVCFYGPSGFGKSFAASYSANRHQAYYIECKSTWSRKAVLQEVLKEMGVATPRTIYAMTDAICEQLALSGRPLIIDEMDHLVEKSAVEVIRDLYEGSKAAILLIGEEMLPKKLEKWERFHGRILDWVPAQPADIDDATHLARLYCREVTVERDLIAAVHKASSGSVRRICVNLERIQEEALSQGLEVIGLSDWGNRHFYTGQAPARRLS